MAGADQRHRVTTGFDLGGHGRQRIRVGQSVFFHPLGSERQAGGVAGLQGINAQAVQA
jgi:hypothetical protein